MNETLSTAYKRLIKKTIEESKKCEKQLTICPSIAGSNNAKVMIIGQAINGWCVFPDNNVENIFEQLQCCNQCTLNWVMGKDYYTNCHCKRKKGDTEKKPISKSKFWQFARFIMVNKENQGTQVDEWVQQVVWSDLYKCSFVAGGNPKGLYKFQKEICDEILVEEIKYYNPNTIYFTTETSLEWFSKKDFPKTFDYLQKLFKGSAYRLKHPCVRKKFEIIFNAKEDIKNL